MARIIQFWTNRHALTKLGVYLTIVFMLIREVYWYINQNVGFTTIKGAGSVGTVGTVFFYMFVGSALVIVLGVLMELFGKVSRPADDRVKVAEGVWMVKK